MKTKEKKIRILAPIHNAPLIKEIRSDIAKDKLEDAIFGIFLLVLSIGAIGFGGSLIIWGLMNVVLGELLAWSALVIGVIALLGGIGYLLFFKDTNGENS